jgi:hypothetical protein
MSVLRFQTEVDHVTGRPIINGLALVTFMLFWVSWKFLLIWVYVLGFLTGAALMACRLDQPESQETSGLYVCILIVHWGQQLTIM